MQAGRGRTLVDKGRVARGVFFPLSTRVSLLNGIPLSRVQDPCSTAFRSIKTLDEEMVMNKLGMIAVAGMLTAVIGMGHFGENARPLAWGFAIAISVLVHWVNSLQKQVNALTSDQESKPSQGN